MAENIINKAEKHCHMVENIKHTTENITYMAENIINKAEKH